MRTETVRTRFTLNIHTRMYRQVSHCMREWYLTASRKSTSSTNGPTIRRCSKQRDAIQASSHHLLHGNVLLDLVQVELVEVFQAIRQKALIASVRLQVGQHLLGAALRNGPGVQTPPIRHLLDWHIAWELVRLPRQKIRAFQHLQPTVN